MNINRRTFLKSGIAAAVIPSFFARAAIGGEAGDRVLVLVQLDGGNDGLNTVVPYGDPREQHFRKNAFDLGEYGLGMLANPLTLGCDCLGEIRYFDAHMTDSRGELFSIQNAVCMHEEDHGMLWKHTDWRTDEVEVRRSRRLVISFIATVANYEYAFSGTSTSTERSSWRYA